LLNVDLEVNSLTISKLLLAVQCELFQVLLVASQRKLMYAASKEGKDVVKLASLVDNYDHLPSPASTTLRDKLLSDHSKSSDVPPCEVLHPEIC
jgi:hypothetical protein